MLVFVDPQHGDGPDDVLLNRIVSEVPILESRYVLVAVDATA